MATVESAAAVAIRTQRPRILLPGIRRLPPGVERYVVPGGGAVVVRVFAGDVLRIVNSQGGQVCEIVATAPDGRESPGILGGDDAGPATGRHAMLARGGREADALLRTLDAQGLSGRFAHSIRRFAARTPAFARSEERRVGEECSSRGAPDH